MGRPTNTYLALSVEFELHQRLLHTKVADRPQDFPGSVGVFSTTSGTSREYYYVHKDQKGYFGIF
jgi:hypothetical protein